MLRKLKHSRRTLRGILALLSASFLGACQPPTVPTQSAQGTSPLNSDWGAGLSPFRNRFGRRGTQNLGGLQTQSVGQGRLVQDSRTGNVYLSPVPFVRQGEDNTCAQAVMTMLLQYWGQEIDYQQVVNENNPFNLGTSYDVIQSYLSRKGLQVEALREGSLEALITEIHQGRPVIALLDFGSLFYAHYILVVGYNAQRNTLIFHESRSGAYMELGADEFQRMWENEPLVNLPVWGGANYQRLMFTVQG